MEIEKMHTGQRKAWETTERLEFRTLASYDYDAELAEAQKDTQYDCLAGLPLLTCPHCGLSALTSPGCEGHAGWLAEVLLVDEE